MRRPLIECLRDYILGFPELKNGCLCNVDYLGDQSIEYDIEAVPCDPVYKRYIDGDCMKQFLFLFASREEYNAQVATCIANLHFYEKFEEWIEDNNANGNFPDLDGRLPVSIEVLTRGYPLSAEADTARYQIQLRLIYEEE